MKTLLIVLTIALSISTFGQTNKIKPEELVIKHLASIGSTEDRASVKSLIIVGNTKASARLNYTGEFTGVSQIGSEGNKVLLAQIFNSTNYPYEKAGYNGEKLTVSPLPEGRRSLLSNFFMSNEAIFKEGLIGGVLTSAWALHNPETKNLKLSYSGTAKINNRQSHKLKYTPKKGGELQVTLFFDAETFAHLRSEYQFVISPRMGTASDQAVKQRERRYKLVEEFSDFKKEGRLTLPHTYKIHYMAEEQNSSQWVEWVSMLSQFVFNQPIDTDSFNVSGRN